MKHLAVVLFCAVAWSPALFAEDRPDVPDVPEVPEVPEVPGAPPDGEDGDVVVTKDGVKLKEDGNNISINIGASKDDDEHPIDVINRLPEDVREKLTGEDVENIIRVANDRGNDELVAVVVPLSFFATILGIVLGLQLLRQRRERMLHDTLREMIDRGVDIPPALFLPKQKKPNDRRRGIILVSVGAGLSGLLMATDGFSDGSWGIGLMPLLIGLGYLVAHTVEAKDTL